MSKLETTYMGLKLKNPFIVSSSGLTDSVQKVVKAAEAGAGAVVLKSLFEEDIAAAVNQNSSLDTYAMHSEAMAYMEQLGMMSKPDSYLELVEEAVKAVDIPIIASLNCYSEQWWLDYAKRIEKMGAHALELNIALVPVSVAEKPEKLEKQITGIVKKAAKALKIPIAVKIGSFFTSLPHTVWKIRQAGASGLVLFNRFYRPDIDIRNLKFKQGNPLSGEEEFGTVLRWTGILSDLVDCDFSATTGVYSSETAIKLLMAGADTVQFCSLLYKKGVGHMARIISETEAWMEEHDFKAVSDFYSLLSLEDDVNRKYYQRLQYLKALKGLK